ncbi:homocysteine S-methyltransferase family protein [uncultured Ruthenibacterium sp.]|uniref:homocysteine S-methyltransferase family protein n=1 Tax=uncultured Ruthenibacterium sp. TaxID=1905347 RepID=UPI00349E627D
MIDVFQKKRYTILDGAMGTMLQKRGLELGRQPDVLSVENPAVVSEIGRMYVESGADWICANTFGANRKKLAGCGYTVEQVVTAAVQCARKACAGTDCRVFLDVGPIGELLEPVGTLRFEEAYEIFSQEMKAGAQAGAQGILIETMTDLYEVKAALLAAKENTNLPVLVSMSFEERGRTFTGCSVEAFAVVAEGLGADAIGINCSLGPREILPLARRLCESTSRPVFIKPNAGLPDPSTGKYDISPYEFCSEMKAFEELGIRAVGGCCGTTPEYIRILAQYFRNKCPVDSMFVPKSIVCTPTETVAIERVTVIGERINPTGKKRFQEALRTEDWDYIAQQAIEQTNAGARILDVNVGLPGIDEVQMMVKAIKTIQSVTDTPLQLDSTRPKVLEAGLRVYNGKAIVNSVNAEPASLKAILPICRKYGAAVVGLTLNDEGIPDGAEERLALAEKIVCAAEEAGIRKEDVFIDCLTLTVSAQQKAVQQTLKAVRLVKEKLGVKTVLGVSNISFGLPCREQVNTSFLTLAMEHGLDLPILNPNSQAMMAAVASFEVLYNRDPQATRYIAKYSGSQPQQHTLSEKTNLHDSILQGLRQQAAQAARLQLETCSPQQLVNQVLIPALDLVGEEFEKGKLFLPQLLQSAGAAQAAFDVVKEKIVSQGSHGNSKGKIVIATVKGDIHDIGKNIVKVILENYGYEMIDLGRDVPAQVVVEAARKYQVQLVGLSALMTTTLPSMAETIDALHKANLPCKIMVGGAVLTPEYAKTIGADFYAKDAKQSVDIAKEVLG